MVGNRRSLERNSISASERETRSESGDASPTYMLSPLGATTHTDHFKLYAPLSTTFHSPSSHPGLFACRSYPELEPAAFWNWRATPPPPYLVIARSSLITPAVLAPQQPTAKMPPRPSPPLSSLLSALTSLRLTTPRPSPLNHATTTIRTFTTTPTLQGSWLEPNLLRKNKMMKGRPRVPTGGSTKGTTVVWGDYGLRMCDHGRRISAKHFKMAEDTIKARLRGQKYRLYKRKCCNVGVFISGNEVSSPHPLFELWWRMGDGVEGEERRGGGEEGRKGGGIGGSGGFHVKWSRYPKKRYKKRQRSGVMRRKGSQQKALHLMRRG